MNWRPPANLDLACRNLCIALNGLPGIHTTDSCCGHGKDFYRIWLVFEAVQTLGTITLARCLSGRYYRYAPDELRFDPQWRLYLADTEGTVHFVLEGKPMTTDGAYHLPAEILATNLQEHISEDFDVARRALAHRT